MLWFEPLYHAGVAEGVWLHPREIEELGHAFIVRAQQLSVDIRGNQLSVLIDCLEPVPTEEIYLESQTEQLAQTEITGPLFDGNKQSVADATAKPFFRDTERSHLAQVLPNWVDCAVTDDSILAIDRHHELRHGAIELNQIFPQQNSSLDQRCHELDHCRDIAGARVPHPDLRSFGGHEPSVVRPKPEKPALRKVPERGFQVRGSCGYSPLPIVGALEATAAAAEAAEAPPSLRPSPSVSKVN